MQFEEIMSSLACENQPASIKKADHLCCKKLQKDYEKFLYKYESISNETNQASNKDAPTESNGSNDSIAVNCIEAEPNKLIDTLNQLIPCISCRASVERLYKEILQRQWDQKQEVGNFVLDPFVFTSNGNITLKRSVLSSPMSIFKIFYINGFVMCYLIQRYIIAICNSKKSIIITITITYDDSDYNCFCFSLKQK